MTGQNTIDDSVFRGCMPAIMTPTNDQGKPDFDVMVKYAGDLVTAEMTGVVYCGSMGDWPLIGDELRREGVQRLVEAGIKVVVRTGSQSPLVAAEHAKHAADVGAAGGGA